MSGKIRLGVLGDWTGLGTGFGCVTRNILTRLQATGRYDIFHLAIGFSPDRAIKMMPESMEKLKVYEAITSATHPWDVGIGYPHGIPSFPVSGKDMHGRDCLRKFIETFNIEVMLVIGDVWMSAQITASGDENLASYGCRFVHYQPLDGVCADSKLPWEYFPISPGNTPMVPWAELMRRQHSTVLYGEWGAAAYLQSLEPEDRQDAATRLEVIPHGVDFQTFYPFPKNLAREALNFPPELRMTEQAFVIGMVAANQGRKDWPGAFRAVGKFMAKHPNAWFFPWASWLPPSDGWDFHRLAVMFAPKNRVIKYPPVADALRNIPHDALRNFYNAIDVHVLLHHGEGCGLPHLEAQACGTPALATDYAGIKDYFADSFQRIAPVFRVTGGRNCIERPDSNERMVLAKLERLYGSPKLRLELGRKEIAFARAHWNWNQIGEQWDAVLTRAAMLHRGGSSCLESAVNAGSTPRSGEDSVRLASETLAVDPQDVTGIPQRIEGEVASDAATA